MNDARIRSIIASVEKAQEHALEQAVQLARSLKCRLKIIDTLSRPPRSRKIAAPHSDELTGLARSLKRERLRDLSLTLTAQFLDVEAAILEGEIVSEMVSEVLRNGHDIVVLPAEQSARGYRVGATHMHLLRKCPCSVWIVRPDRTVKRIRILATVATDPGDLTHAHLNGDVLRLANTLARSLGGELHVLHVWRAIGESMFAHSAFCRMTYFQLVDYLEDTKQQHANELHALLEQCDVSLPANRVHLLKGEPQTTIREFCRVQTVDLLVVGTLARKGIPAFVLGNTAEAIANEVECSVIAVKGAGAASH